MKSDKLAQITDRQMPALWIPRFLNEFVFFLFLITFLATCSNSVEIDDTGDFPLASANPIILDCSGKNNIFGSRREAVRLGYRGLNIYKRSTPDPRGTSVFEIEDSKSCRAKIRGNSISYGPMEFVEGTTGIDHSSGRLFNNSHYFPTSLQESIARAESLAASQCHLIPDGFGNVQDFSEEGLCASRVSQNILKSGVVFNIDLGYLGRGTTIFMIAFEGRLVGYGVVDADVRSNNTLFDIQF